MHETDEYVIIQITITRVITGYLRQFIKLKPPYNLPGLSNCELLPLSISLLIHVHVLYIFKWCVLFQQKALIFFHFN